MSNVAQNDILCFAENSCKVKLTERQKSLLLNLEQHTEYDELPKMSNKEIELCLLIYQKYKSYFVKGSV